MNIIVFYNNLSDQQKLKLARDAKKSPLKQRLLQYLQQTDSNSFSTNKTIEYVYADELKNGLEYKIAENRFYKLRKRFIEFCEEENLTPKKEFILTEQEKELNEIFLESENNKELKLKRLNKLEKKCWENNIFELLPKILFYQFRLGKPVAISEYTTASKLVADLHTTQQIIITLQEFSISINSYKKEIYRELKRLKTIYLANKKFIRFKYIYNYYSVLWKCNKSFSKSKLAYARNLNTYTSIYLEYPDVPMIEYMGNYKTDLEIRNINLLIQHYRYINDFKRALLYIEKKFKLADTNTSYMQGQIRVADHVNMITFLLKNKKTTEAWEYTEKYRQFLFTQNRTELYYDLFVQRANILIESFPNTPIKNYQHIIKGLKQTLKKKEIRKTPSRENLILYTICKLLLVDTQFKKAYTLLKKKQLKDYISKYIDYNLLATSIGHLASKTYTHNKKFLLEKYKHKLSTAKTEIETEVYENLYRLFSKL
ncbi:MAG: hypothetical protein J0M08_03410 [Bacteroidetes bacterium]|nr:hypothetical protein [Bacteroidota bacterium]